MSDQDDYLALQLYGLECRLQRGEHLQEGGQHLMREYRALKAAQGKGVRKAKRDHSAVDQSMIEQLASCACPACGGVLKQTRSGSLRARCLACDGRWDFQVAESVESSEASSKSCRMCHAFFGVRERDLSRDSGCGICVRCMRDIQSELLDSESAEFVHLQQAKAFAEASPREQFDYWLTVRGQSSERPEPETLDYLAPVVARGQDWVPCVDAVPAEDRFGLLHYMVYAPSNGGFLIRCRYAAGRWSYGNGEAFLGGATHWRIARSDEFDHDADSCDLPGTRSE